ncbi:hypothetical protein RYX45_06565 [Alkalihalophilus pseudofirmus]|uniref:Lipoprotein n=1 Tax=Alkalihalophilus pseudofirmus TaxID=79885 RepID=A0AAJ2L136_ALKPS|nr:hypothetical protein [Alkalihalophilus pseudofirmus]MDV2884834.1 hypothetical protein [Alkalihalophilus pseudofirmus]
MSRKKITVLCITGLLILFSAGCSTGVFQSNNNPTIKAAPNSDYVEAFEAMHLGILFDFELYVPDADKRWVNLWVERYHKGELDPEPLTHLSYGSQPSDKSEGPLGFGLINPNTEDPLIFLYAPGVSIIPSSIEEELQVEQGGASTWSYAISEDTPKSVELGETVLLAAYRQSSTGKISSVDFESEEDIEQMLEEDSTVLLLKMKIEEDIE